MTRKPRSHVRILIYRTWPIGHILYDGKANELYSGAVPHSHPRMKISLKPDRIIITALEKRLEGLGLYKNKKKIGGRGSFGPSLNPPMMLNRNIQLNEMRITLLPFIVS